jgi:putative ABC transport system permease protein
MIELWNRLRDVFRRDRLAKELEEELRFHADQLASDRRADGMTAHGAERAARRRLGNRTRIAEEARAMWSVAWVEHLVQDLRYGMRALRRSPAFAVVAALTLALGIGANTAIFTVVNGVVLKPLPYGDPGRLVMLWETMKDVPQILVAYPNFLDWRTRTTAFDGLAIYNGFDAFNLTGMGDAERVRGGLGSGNLFDVLGVRAVVGRTFRADDDVVGAPRVAILSDGMWRRRFGADTSAVGTTITLDGFTYTIVGVLPPRVQLARADLWVPIGLWANTPRFNDRANHPGTIGIGRVKPGVTLDEMRADLDRVARQLQADYPKENAGIGASGDWLINMVVGDIRPALYVLVGAVGLVLVIACANTANLLLGRAAGRQREMALRVAIGARRGRIVRQLLTESMLLSLIGGVLGVGFAWAGVRVLLALRPSNVPRLMDVHLDGTVLAFALIMSVVTGLVFGIAPAVHAAGGDVVTSLKEGARGATGGRLRLKMRSTLMVAEVALALVLLVGAGLLKRSFANLMRVDPGVDPHNVIAGLVQLPEHKYAEAGRRNAQFEELLQRAKAIPGVTDAALSTDLPTSSSWQANVTFEGQPPEIRGQEPLFGCVLTSPDWFSAMRMRFSGGHAFAPTDVQGMEQVVVISDAVAKRFFADQNPVGRRLKLGPLTSTSPWITIVGVVNDVKDRGLSLDARGTLYFPVAQNAPGALSLAVRSTAPTATVVAMMRWVVFGSDGHFVTRVTTPPRFRVMQIGPDFVLGVRYDADDVPVVEVHRLRKG